MKSQVFLEYAGKQIKDQDVVNSVKDDWLKTGHKIKDIKTLNIYLKPEDSAYYYVINDELTGSIPM